MYGIAYSPWSERARWGLDHHGLAYRYHEHVPFLGEPLLRLRGRRTGEARVTVPLLIHGDEVLMDSLQILEHADRCGQGEPLVHDRDAVVGWRDRLEPALAAGRARTTGLVLRDPEALREAAMAVSPGFVAGLLRPVAAHGARYLSRKYGFDVGDPTPMIETMRVALAAIRQGLEHDGRHLVGGRFGAADIIATNVLQFVQPIEDAYIALKPATRRAWSCPELAEAFGDLVAWRDEIYRAYR